MSQTLSMKFGLESGGDRVISLPGPKANLTAAAASAALNAMVTAGEAFAASCPTRAGITCICRCKRKNFAVVFAAVVKPVPKTHTL